MSEAGLIKQTATGERYDMQKTLVALSREHSGYTMTQLAWLASGGQVDELGKCQPETAFKQMLRFFNFKRRGSEIACERGELESKPRAKLVYGKARNNPYDFGGAGIYPRDGKYTLVASAPLPEAVSAPEAAPVDPAAKQQALGDALAALED